MTVLSRFAGFIQLARPGNLVLIAVAVVTGTILAGGVEGLLAEGVGTMAMAVAATVLVAAGANAINDVLDVSIDRTNGRQRPIVVGTVSRGSAIVFWLAATCAGLILALGVSGTHFLFAGAFAALLALYNWRLKHVAIVGNLTCAAAVAATLVFGGLAFGLNTTVWVGATFAVLTMVAREIVKDLEDLPGDVAAGSHTLPIVAGPTWTRGLALAVIFATIAAVPVPYVAFNFSTTYLTVAVVAVAFLMSSAWVLADSSRYKARQTAAYTRASLYLKLSMVAGLAAILLARVPA